MAARKISQEKFDRYCALRDQASDLEESVYKARTLAEKLAIRTRQKALRNEAFMLMQESLEAERHEP